MENVLLVQLIAHLLADFFFQKESWCSDKRQNGYHSKPMYIHAGIIFATSILMTFSWSFILFALLIAYTVPEYLANGNTRYLLMITSALVCIKPANVFIRNLLSSLNLFPDSQKTEVIVDNKDL